MGKFKQFYVDGVLTIFKGITFLSMSGSAIFFNLKGRDAHKPQSGKHGWSLSQLLTHEVTPLPPIEGMPVVIAGLLPAVFLWCPIKYTWEEGDDVLTGLTEQFLAAKRVR